MTQAEAFQLLAQLGVRPEDLARVQRAPSFEAAKAQLEELKVRVRAAWKRAAFDLHPDRTGGDPEKTRLYTALNGVRQDFEGLEMRLPPPPPPVLYVRVPFNASTAYTSSTSSTNVVNVYYAVNVRPV